MRGRGRGLICPAVSLRLIISRRLVCDIFTLAKKKEKERLARRYCAFLSV